MNQLRIDTVFSRRLAYWLTQNSEASHITIMLKRKGKRLEALHCEAVYPDGSVKNKVIPEIDPL